tara:strand:- start:218 stop:667 length:450 start_codon:yes stop_codon:yes gene_type:complete
MTDYRIVEFVPEHADDLWEREDSLATAERGLMKREIIVNMARAGHAFSLLTKGHLIAAGGIFPIWDGFGEAWFIPSNLIKAHKRQVIEQLREHVERLSREDGYRRLQATARTDFAVGQRFLEFLGFEREGRLRKYGPDGADHYLYARLM